eukprot:scaffold20646_cov101-Isochrysis_galbana.AAC.1
MELQPVGPVSGQEAAMRVKLARTVSGDDEEHAGEEDAPELDGGGGGGQPEPHESNWWRAHKVIYAKRLARTAAATARLQRAA